jgi:hypothetical protein
MSAHDEVLKPETMEAAFKARHFGYGFPDDGHRDDALMNFSFGWYAAIEQLREGVEQAPEQMREAAAKICDGVNNFDNPMTASDCVDAIRALPVGIAQQSPEAVQYALNRMLTPLHESHLSGVTAERDAVDMATIRDYVIALLEEKAQLQKWLDVRNIDCDLYRAQIAVRDQEITQLKAQIDALADDTKFEDD